MSTPKKYPPYHVRSDGNTIDAWIVDASGNDVVTSVGMSRHYSDIYLHDIMKILCDALNRKEGV
jgi:hypothetical protein